MTKEIGRLHSFGLGLETTPGTAISADDWIPVETASLMHSIEKIKDTNSFGVIDEISDSHVAKEMSEFQASGIARSQSLGYLLRMALGTAGTATLVETSVYSHAFTRLNSNSHPSATIYHANNTTDVRAPYHMLDSLELTFNVNDYVRFAVNTKGGKIADNASTPAFNTGTDDEAFRVSSATIKFASSIAGLGGASAIDLQNMRLSIEKNTAQIFKVGSTEINSNHNQQFNVSGDFEAVYNADTYRDYLTANTKTAIQIEVLGTTLIGATEYNKMTIQIAQAGIDEWSLSDGNNDIITQTCGFTSEYSFGDTQTINISIQNVKSDDY